MSNPQPCDWMPCDREARWRARSDEFGQRRWFSFCSLHLVWYCDDHPPVDARSIANETLRTLT